MLKDRITAKDLKTFLEGVSDDSEVFVNIYEQDKYKEYLTFRSFDENGELQDKELCIVSIKENEK